MNQIKTSLLTNASGPLEYRLTNDYRALLQRNRFLDFTLFEEYPEFYATYMFMNVKNHSIYSDKLRLSVVELNQIELATDEDKQYGIDYWAALFKAETWEEIKMLANENEYLNEASETMRELISEQTIRDQCFAREEYERHERAVKAKMDKLNSTITEQKTSLAEKDAIISDQSTLITQLQAELEQLKNSK